MDGWVTIGTSLDNTQLEKDLKDAEKNLKQFSKEEENLLKQKSKAEADLSGYKKEQEEYSKLVDKAEEYKAKIYDLEQQRKGLFQNGALPSNQFGNYQDLSSQIQQVKDESLKLNAQIEKQTPKLESANAKYQEQEYKLKEINAKLQENAGLQEVVKDKISEINGKLAQAKTIDNLGSEVKSVSKELTSIIGKVSKWALAIFSVRTAYNLLRQASSTLSQYNKQYAADLQYIQYALAQMLKPVLETIVNLAFKLLTYINYIASAWFGVNLFSGASAKNFQSASSSLAKSAKSAKELKKQLAGFDEMNILSDDSSATSGASGGGAIAPSVDLSKLDIEIPKWLQWIVDNKDGILQFFELLGSLISGIKIGDLLNSLGILGKDLSFIQKLGIGVMIYGIIELVKDLVSYIQKLDGSLENNGTSWEDFGNIITDIGIILAGLALIIGGIPLTVAAAITLILGLIIKNWDKIKGYLQSAVDWIDNNIDWIQEHFGIVGVFIATTIRDAIKTAISWVERLFTSFKQIFDGILLIFKGDFKNGFISIAKGLANLVIQVINWCINRLNSAINGALNSMIGKTVQWGASLVGVNLSSVKIPTISYLKTGGIVNMPGRGVPIGGAIAAEAGQEGVIPLTDAQAMAQLGEAIGKYITINANITNTMNGRVISRQLQKIKANQEFQYNT